MPPIVYPTVTVWGRTLILKPTGLYTFLLDQWGIDMSQMAAQFQHPGPGRFALAVKMFAGLVAHNYIERGETIPTPEQWSLKLTEIPQKEWIDAVFAAAFTKKAPPVEAPPSQPLPAETKPPVQ